MSFDTRTGTRGRRQPGGWIKPLNKLAINRIRRRGEAGADERPSLDHHGAQERRRTPDSTRLVPRPRRQLADRRRRCRNHRESRVVPQPRRTPRPGHCRSWRPQGRRDRGTTPPADRDQAWQRITTAAPTFAKYQKATDRELPVIRLLPHFAPGVRGLDGIRPLLLTAGAELNLDRSLSRTTTKCTARYPIGLGWLM